MYEDREACDLQRHMRGLMSRPKDEAQSDVQTLVMEKAKGDNMGPICGFIT